MKRWLPVLLVVASALVLAAGLIFGDLSAVYHRAAQICLECIGVG